MRLRGLQKGGWLEVRKSIILKVMLSLVPEESNSSRCFPNTVTKRVFFFMHNSPMNFSVWWVLPSLKCCVTKVRLSIAFRNEADGGLLERPELSIECDGQVGAKSGAYWGSVGQREKVISRKMWLKTQLLVKHYVGLTVSFTQLEMLCILTTEPGIY